MTVYSRSKGLESLDDRMKDVELLLDSHKEAMRRAQLEKELAEAESLEDYMDAMGAIVSEPGRGRPPALGALNRAAIVLLSAQLQGYIEDVYDEAAEFLLGSKVKDIGVLRKHGKNGFGHPHSRAVDGLFASLGLAKMTGGIEWSGFRNDQVKGRLKELIQLRNKIAHGERVPVRKVKVTKMKGFVERLAGRFDERLFETVHEVTGREPW